MRKIIAITALGLGASCGRVADLEPQAGKSLPQKPELAARALTAEELLALPPQAKPDRVDELRKRGDTRQPDRFDLPPPDGEAAPPAEGDDEPQPSTTGPDNEREPRR
ncbi:MAG TPA: hypothetical protein VNA29_07445 [Sphingomicrobium sp.]|nr:hypothetical protein [Sphingomicrobium sp.]